VPQTKRPSGHVTPGVVTSAPQLTLQFAVAAHVATQSASHLRSQLVSFSQRIVAPRPRLNLHTASSWHTAVEPAPAFRSQFDCWVHVITLLSPPLPLHALVSVHSSVSGPALLPSHLAALAQSSEHAVEPQSVLQSAPATHSQANPLQLQPLPAHVALSVSLSSLPQPAPAKIASATSHFLVDIFASL
jgi:hypothetical protein